MKDKNGNFILTAAVVTILLCDNCQYYIVNPPPPPPPNTAIELSMQVAYFTGTAFTTSIIIFY